jgi:hypothetical protein
MKRTALVLAATAAVLAAPGVALADTNPASTAAHACYTHPDLCAEPQDHNLDGAFVVTRPPSLAEQIRQTLAQALVDLWRGPQW